MLQRCGAYAWSSMQRPRGSPTMQLIDFFDSGAAIDPAAPCFIYDDTGATLTYADIRNTTLRVGNALRADGFVTGVKAAVLSPNDALAFACLLGIVRAGMVWVAVNPKNGVEENSYILDNFEAEVLFYHSVFEPAIAEIRKRVPRLSRIVCIDKRGADAPSLDEWLREQPATEIDP